MPGLASLPHSEVGEQLQQDVDLPLVAEEEGRGLGYFIFTAVLRSVFPVGAAPSGDGSAVMYKSNERSGEPIGRRADTVDDEAEHLEEDLDARMFGTHDVQSAIERGTAWNPPDEPTPEGFEPDQRGEL